MNRFQKLVAEAKAKITEISPADAKAQCESGGAVLIDVREGEDWREDHAKGAKHFERGTIELEIEEQVPDLKTPIICYCGGGSRSALVAESLQKMGYENVRSIAGGFRSFLRRFGWARVGPVEIFGLGRDVPRHLDLVKIALSERTEMEPHLPPELLPVQREE